MKRLKMYGFIIAMIVMTALLLVDPWTPAAQAQNTTELRLAHMFPVGSPSAQHIDRWAKKIATDSNGRLTIRIFPSNTLIAAPEMYDGVVKGAADIGFAWRYKPTNYNVGVHFPFLITAPDTVTAGKVYDDIWKQFPKLMEEEWKDVKILWLSPTMPVYLCTSKPVHNMNDMKGLQIRVPSKALAGVVQELGAAPAFMPTADFVVALEKGTVDGGTPLFGIVPDYKLAGKIKYVIQFSLGNATPVMVIMNKDSFNKLPAELQRVLVNANEWAKQDAIEYWNEANADAVKYCKDNGIELVTLTPEEETKWAAVVQRAKNTLAADLDAKGYPGTALVQFINERIKHYAP